MQKGKWGEGGQNTKYNNIRTDWPNNTEWVVLKGKYNTKGERINKREEGEKGEENAKKQRGVGNTTIKRRHGHMQGANIRKGPK